MVVPAIVSPTAAFVVAVVLMLVIYPLLGRRRPGQVARGFRLGQVLSSGLLSLSHGTNDGQKTMGVITLALLDGGSIPARHVHVPVWVILASASALALGTYAAGWRIIKTTGWAWMLTLPAAAVAAAAIWALIQALGGGPRGPLVLFAATAVTVLVVLARRLRERPVTAAGS